MLSKGLYDAASKSGWSILELADRAGVQPSLLEEASVGVEAWDVVSTLTGFSVGEMRRMGLGLDPIKDRPY